MTLGGDPVGVPFAAIASFPALACSLETDVVVFGLGGRN